MKHRLFSKRLQKTPKLSSITQTSSYPKPVKRRRTISLRLALLSSLGFAIFFSGLSLGGSWLLLKDSSLDSASIEERREVISSEGDVFNRIASDVGKSVVSIVVKGSGGTEAAGTGVVIDSSGLILTNKHVIPATATQVSVVDHTNTTHNAQIIGRDSTNDIAFIRVADLPSSIPPAKLADSSKVKVGDKVLAIGNALGEFQNTVTSGIVSGIGRPIDISDDEGLTYESLFNLIQTDAAINPGNSGGPLVNMSGEVIGINTAIVQDAQSLGFSIPINDAKALIAQVEQTGDLGQKAYLGVRYVNLNASIAEDLSLGTNEGALIYDATNNPIESGSPAATGGSSAVRCHHGNRQRSN
jgi:S1-C subfamily serine protease